MTDALDRRLTRLENQRPDENCPYAIMPAPCKTMEEWLTQVESKAAGKGHYELEPTQPGAYVRIQRWVADQ